MPVAERGSNQGPALALRHRNGEHSARRRANKEDAMATIHLHQTTTATPEQFLAALTDFGPGRSKLFGNSTDQYLKVHHLGATDADVTEGSRGIWERLHYDWSDPNRIVMTTTDSNTWGGNSGHTYTLTRQPDGTTDIDAVVVREGMNVKGKLLGLLVGSVGKGVLAKELAKTAKAVEARGDAAATGDGTGHHEEPGREAT
jgi:hypothetical protein